MAGVILNQIGGEMTFQDFSNSLRQNAPPLVPPLLRALWHDAKGDWAEAHRVAQDTEGADAAWVHAYLHRKEGDLTNAAYWYRRAGRPVASGDLAIEWQRLCVMLIESSMRLD